MKKLIVLSATALLLAGCSAAASTAPATAPAASAGTSAAAASAPATSASASAAPALTLEQTCTGFNKALMDNRPAPGTADNQKYWATVRDALIPIRAGAAPEAKKDLEGVFTWFNTRAEHWDPATAQQLGQAADPSLKSLGNTCKPFAPKS